jgi:hypothetical protein
MTENDLASGNVATKAITPNGLKIGLEAKGRSRHQGSFFVTKGEQKDQPNEVLESFLRKSAALDHGEGFLGMLVTTEPRTEKATEVTRITLADPGAPTTLSSDEEDRLLLRALLPRIRRIGLWGTLHSASEWLCALGEPLSVAEADLLRRVRKTDIALITEKAHGSEYRGRVFSDVVRRLGAMPTRRPMLDRNEIERRLAENDPGLLWFCGLDVSLSKAIGNRDSGALRRLGIGTNAPATVRVPVDNPSIASSVISELRQALPAAR